MLNFFFFCGANNVEDLIVLQVKYSKTLQTLNFNTELLLIIWN